MINRGSPFEVILDKKGMNRSEFRIDNTGTYVFQRGRTMS